jgi:hypothetical protein
MNEDGVMTLLTDHLGSNECMILLVGEPDSFSQEGDFRVGQTYHNNQEAVVELAWYGYFPEGTLFAVKPRPKRKDPEIEVLMFVEVHDGELVTRELTDIEERVNWARVHDLIEGRMRWEKRISEIQQFELEMYELPERVQPDRY